MSDLPVLTISNTRMAACLDALGFTVRSVDATLNVNETDPKKKVLFQFLFECTSTRLPQLGDARTLADDWTTGKLAKENPMHLLCVMMHAQHNYDRLCEWQGSGRPMHLERTAGGKLMRYQAGSDVASITHSENTVPQDDLCLVAALGLAGIPLVKMAGPPGARTYFLKRVGKPLLDSANHEYVNAAPGLMERAPTKEDPLRLKLEDVLPLHPVVVGYDALHARRVLKKELEAIKPLILTQEGGHPITNDFGHTRLSVRQALFHPNAEGHVMAAVERHMKSPPIPKR